MTSETPSTVKTAAGAVYRKSDIAKAKVNVQDAAAQRQSPTGKEPKKKLQKKSQRNVEDQGENEDSWSEDDLLPQQQVPHPDKAKNEFQDNQTVVKSKDTETGGVLNLAVKRAKPSNARPLTKSTKIKSNGGKKDKKQSTQEASQNKLRMQPTANIKLESAHQDKQ